MLRGPDGPLSEDVLGTYLQGVVVPAGTQGWENLPDGFLWIEYTL
jgi:hypothetical protein